MRSLARFGSQRYQHPHFALKAILRSLLPAFITGIYGLEAGGRGWRMEISSKMRIAAKVSRHLLYFEIDNPAGACPGGAGHQITSADALQGAIPGDTPDIEILSI